MSRNEEWERREEEREAILREIDGQMQPECPRCGRIMIHMEENYNLDTPYLDCWYECVGCGYCVDCNFNQ